VTLIYSSFLVLDDMLLNVCPFMFCTSVLYVVWSMSCLSRHFLSVFVYLCYLMHAVIPLLFDALLLVFKMMWSSPWVNSTNILTL
jgi:hypothetical protein